MHNYLNSNFYFQVCQTICTIIPTLFIQEETNYVESQKIELGLVKT